MQPTSRRFGQHEAEDKTAFTQHHRQPRKYERRLSRPTISPKTFTYHVTSKTGGLCKHILHVEQQTEGSGMQQAFPTTVSYIEITINSLRNLEQDFICGPSYFPLEVK